MPSPCHVSESLSVILKSLVVLIVCLYDIHLIKLSAQCNPPFSPPIFCEEAGMECFGGYCFATGNEPVLGFNGFCGPNTAIHNPQYFSFVASETTVEIYVHVDSCDSGVGLQSALISVCPWNIKDVLACDPGTPPGGTMVIRYEEAEPGQQFWFVVDGSSGSTCHYSFTEISGVLAEEILPAPDSATTMVSGDTFCPGQDSVLLTLSPYDGVHLGYSWTTTWDMMTYETQDTFMYLTIPSDAIEGDWNICARIVGSCQSSPPVCVPIHITKGAPAFDTVTICPEMLPFYWDDILVTFPGTYSKAIQAPGECTYDSILTVLSHPIYIPDTIEVTTCQSVYEAYDQTFPESGLYTVVLSEQNIYGCDSLIQLDVHVLGLHSFVEVNCISDSFTLEAKHLIPNAEVAEVTHTWYDCAYDSILSTSPIFVPSSSGCYCLIVDTGICADTLCSEYTINPCESPCSLQVEDICAGEQSAFYPLTAIQANADIYWVLENGTETVFIQQIDTLRRIFEEPKSWSVSVTVRDSSGTYTCYNEFYVADPPNVDLCCDVVACTPCVDLQLLNFGGVGTVSISDESGGALQIIGLLHEFTFPVCPLSGSPATYYITEVIPSDPACPTQTGILDSVVIVTNDTFSFELEIFTQNELICPSHLPSGVLELLWRECDDTTVLSTTTCFFPDSSGCYCLDVVTEGPCITTACAEYFSIQNEEIHLTGVALFPNPVSDQLQIKTGTHISVPFTYHIVSLDGQIVSKGILTEQQSSVRTADIPNGLYLFEIQTNHEKWCEKIIIQR